MTFSLNDENSLEELAFPKVCHFLHTNHIVLSGVLQSNEFLEFVLSGVYLMKFHFFSSIKIKTTGGPSNEGDCIKDILRRKVWLFFLN